MISRTERINRIAKVFIDKACKRTIFNKINVPVNHIINELDDLAIYQLRDYKDVYATLKDSILDCFVATYSLAHYDDFSSIIANDIDWNVVKDLVEEMNEQDCKGN